MKLMTQELRRKLPPLLSTYDQGEEGEQALVLLKLFTPDSNWTWYITEFDGDDTMFGLVDGLEVELGYVSLSELERVTGPLGLHVERDLHWQPRTLAEVREEVLR